MECGPLPTPTRGRSEGNLTTYPNKILFSCDEGFTLNGSAVRMCQPNGAWSGEQGHCQGTLEWLLLEIMAPTLAPTAIVFITITAAVTVAATARTTNGQ